MEVGAVVSLVIGPVIVLLVPTLVWSEPIVRVRRRLQTKIVHSFKAIAAQVSLGTQSWEKRR